MGHNGDVVVRYTTGPSDDITSWKRRNFSPPGDKFDSSKFEFEVSRLEPDSLYRIMIKLVVSDIKAELMSEIQKIKLPEDPKLPVSIEAVNSTTFRFAFTAPKYYENFEARVQIRYTVNDDDDDDDDYDSDEDDNDGWVSEIRFPPTNKLTSSKLEFEIYDLVPDTSYKVEVKLILADFLTGPKSKTLTVKLPEEEDFELH